MTLPPGWWKYLVAFLFVAGTVTALVLLLRRKSSSSSVTPTPASTAPSVLVITSDSTARFDCDRLTPFRSLGDVPVPASSDSDIYMNDTGTLVAVGVYDNGVSFMVRGEDGESWAAIHHVDDVTSDEARLSNDGRYMAMQTSSSNIRFYDVLDRDGAGAPRVLANKAVGQLNLIAGQTQFRMYDFVHDSDFAAVNRDTGLIKLYAKAAGADDWAEAASLDTGLGEVLPSDDQLRLLHGTDTLAVTAMVGGDFVIPVLQRAAGQGPASYALTQTINTGAPPDQETWGVWSTARMSHDGSMIFVLNRSQLRQIWERAEPGGQYALLSEPGLSVDYGRMQVYQNHLLMSQDAGSSLVQVRRINDDGTLSLLTAVEAFATNESMFNSPYRYALARAPVANSVSLIATPASNTTVREFRADCIEAL